MLRATTVARLPLATCFGTFLFLAHRIAHSAKLLDLPVTEGLRPTERKAKNLEDYPV